MKRLLAVLIAAGFSCSAHAQSVCEQLSSAVDTSLKELSFYTLDGILDNSAPRDTNRKLQMVIHTGLLQANLDLMQANKCPVLKTPVSLTVYRANAFECTMAASRADLRGSSGKPEALPECDRSKWDKSYKGDSR